MTPYKEFEFSESVKSVCSSYVSALSSLRLCKVIILGDLGVGKTSLVNRFCHQIYNYNYKATIGVDFEIERFSILNIPFSLQLWDTAGQERFKCIAGAYYRSAHAIVTVFDLNNKESLKHCYCWLREALECNNEEPLKFLVGTKRDLVVDSVYSSMEKEGGEAAKVMGAEYWAVSSKTGSHVNELFMRIAALAFERITKAEYESPDKNYSFSVGRCLMGTILTIFFRY
ncbi:UNVERIFIED_CONTAM: hypothetical protein PYX00_005226 [Menopon gallinae]|uniref:Ras-related protein Rab-36 n=1 Tax=Menopon gallinae TaxID=328185 RepID=A0AAW2HR90_9NEOP